MCGIKQLKCAKNLKLLYIGTLLALGLAMSEPAAADLYDNNYCRTGETEMGNNRVDVKLSYLRPFYDVGIGDVLGAASVSAALQCKNRPPYKDGTFVLQLNVGGGGAGQICDTPLDGVGVRYKDVSGQVIACNKWGDLMAIPSPKENSQHSLFASGVVEFIRTKKTTTLKPGLHFLEMPAQTTINSYWPGISKGQVWGGYKFLADTPLLIADCSITGVTNEVNFGRTLIDDIGNGVSEKPFSVKIGGCGNDNALEEYNSVASMRFQSANTRSDGSLSNGQCERCARGLAIEVKKLNGEKLDLNEIYKMSNGNFNISGDTLSHYFSANLIKVGAEISPGIIETSLTVIITTM